MKQSHPRAPFAVSADGTRIHAAAYGAGKPIVIVHGGMGAAWNWEAAGDILARNYRIVAIERRGYGRSGTPQSPHSMAREAEDIAAVLAEVNAPALLVGQSSGAVASLEAALLHPPQLAGLVIYEPPVQIDTPLGGDSQARQEAALARGDRDEALRIFYREMVELPDRAVDYMSRSPDFAAGWQEMQRLAPNQVEDTRAIRALPLNVERYRAIDVPTLLLRGTESPSHLHRRLDALKAVISNVTEASMEGQGHTANLEAPDVVAGVIAAVARKILG